MAKIPVKKMFDGTTNYFPVSVLNSVFVNKDFEVKNTIGGLQKGAVITANTSLDALISRILVDEGLDIQSELYKKVDKEEGKGLSTNDFTNKYRDQLDTIDIDIKNKVDKEEGKRLMSDEEGAKLAELHNYDDSEIKVEISTKVDKVEGKNLSDENFTAVLKSKLEGIDLTQYVQKNGDKQLSDENFTLEYQTKLENIDLTQYQEKVNGKGLSTNDYDDTEKSYVESINPTNINETVLTAIKTLDNQKKEELSAFLKELLGINNA